MMLILGALFSAFVVAKGQACYIKPEFTYKFAPGNVFPDTPTHRHGLRLLDTAAQCCGLCQSLKNCSFFSFGAGDSCYGATGHCCFLNTAAAAGKGTADAGTTSGSKKPIPTPFIFAKAMGSGMVLAAAPKKAMVWGFCKAGANVDVAFDGGAAVAATVGPDQATGKLTTWRVLLPATAASFDNHTITASSGGKTLTLDGVLFGEVWVCSGQSNMEYNIGTPTCWNASNINCTIKDAQCEFGCTQNAGAEIKAMPNYDDGMRLFTVGQAQSTVPVAELQSATGWQKPSDVGGKFSAACWYFGRDVYHSLSPKVPVGLIATFVGGTPDEHWESQDAIDTCKGPAPWQYREDKSDSVLWNAMVVPLLRTVHSGVIWYQGENNAMNPHQYSCSFPALINDWRAKWLKSTDGATDATFPFGWAQINSGNGYPTTGRLDKYQNPLFIPPNTKGLCGICSSMCNATCLGDLHQYWDFVEYGNQDEGFPGIRYAQSATLSLPKTFQAVIIDTPAGDLAIHSPYKQPCGRRLARGGLAVAYGMTQLHAVDPVVESVKLSGQSVVVTVGGLGPKGIAVTVGAVAFEVLGNCSSQHNAVCWQSTPIASATTNTITLSKLPTNPTAVRFLYYVNPYGTQAGRAPVYALGPAAMPEGTPALPSEFEDESLPLGPFVLHLTR